jgi:hypothetical protein
MAGDPKKMTCAEFQALLPELMSSGEVAVVRPHAQTCELCRMLLADLETIAEAAARKSLPGEGPLIN